VIVGNLSLVGFQPHLGATHAPQRPREPDRGNAASLVREANNVFLLAPSDRR
jgi:hypothetical protein